MSKTNPFWDFQGYKNSAFTIMKKVYCQQVLQKGKINIVFRCIKI